MGDERDGMDSLEAWRHIVMRAPDYELLVFHEADHPGLRSSAFEQWNPFVDTIEDELRRRGIKNDVASPDRVKFCSSASRSTINLQQLIYLRRF